MKSILNGATDLQSLGNLLRSSILVFVLLNFSIAVLSGYHLLLLSTVDVKPMTKTVKYSRTLRVYIDGIKIHPADAHQLMMTAKKLFSSVHLIVGVPTFDGQLYEMLCQCRYVDQVIRSAPPIVDDIFLNHHQIDFVARTQCDVYGVLVAISRARRFRTNLYFQFDLRYDLRV